VSSRARVRIGEHVLGPGEPIFTIAEIGLNHNQDLDLARALVDAAAEAGCSAAKFQTFRADDVYVGGGRAGEYRLMGRDIPIMELHRSLEMSRDWARALAAHCADRGLVFFSAPIGEEALRLLVEVGAPALKVSSYELTDLPYLELVAATGLPVILSTGAATLAEVERAVATLRAGGAPLALMHCVTQYPAPFDAANLAAMDTLRAAFGAPTGFSDHGFAAPDGAIDAARVPLAAARLGADLFEVHVTLDRALPGPDHGFASEPGELKAMVAAMAAARAAWNEGERFEVDPQLLGSPAKRTLEGERYVRDFAFKCLFATRDIAAGERLTPENVRCLRPGQSPRGVEPAHYAEIVGRAVARRPLAAWEPVTWDWLLA